MSKTKATGEDAYPLFWPDGQARVRRPQQSKFKTTLAKARDHLINELKLLGARYVVISSNIPLRRDGLPYASAVNPKDPGVAVYFDYDGQQMVFACDKWDRVRDNVQGIGKTIEALRGIARWGSGDMMRRAVHAFKALPSDGTDWRQILGENIDWGRMSRADQLAHAKVRFRALAAEMHPDKGGSEHDMQRLNKAWETARKELA